MDRNFPDIDLLPCPFCLSQDIRIDLHDDGYKVRCAFCACNSRVIEWSQTSKTAKHEDIWKYEDRRERGLEMAVEAWNTRTPLTKTLTKIRVCRSCISPEIVDANCICVDSNKYDTILLEFNQCPCCGATENQPAETEFNDKQLNNKYGN